MNLAVFEGQPHLKLTDLLKTEKAFLKYMRVGEEEKLHPN